MWSLHVPCEWKSQEEQMKNNALQAKLSEMESKLLGVLSWLVFSATGEVLNAVFAAASE